MNELFKENNTLNVIRTVRDDITFNQIQTSLFINNNKESDIKRSFKVDTDRKTEDDGALITREYVESFIDAMVRVYKNNTNKLNSYSFEFWDYTDKISLPQKVWDIMTFCSQRARECGISIDKIAFGEATATTADDNKSCIYVKVYVAPFSISTSNSMLISKWSKFQLIFKEICHIITSK